MFGETNSNQLKAKPKTGHGVTLPAGSEGRTMGTRFTTENASLRRAARDMNRYAFCVIAHLLESNDLGDMRCKRFCYQSQVDLEQCLRPFGFTFKNKCLRSSEGLGFFP